MRRLALALALAIAFLPSGLAAKPSDRALVQVVFRDFLAAIADRDVAAGVAVLSKGSLAEWQRDRGLALFGARREVAELSPGRRLAVFALRHHEPAFLAADGSPEELAGHAIRAGMADREGLSRVEMSDVIVQGDRASGGLIVSGLPSGFRAAFVREDGRWRFDLPATLEAAGKVVTRAAAASESSENAVIAGMLTMSSGRRPTDRIWEPLAKRRAAAPDAGGQSSLEALAR